MPLRHRVMTFREIAFGTKEYRRECRLSEEVLRRPLGLALSGEDLAGEEDHLHFGLFAPDGELLACVIAVRLSPTEAKIRQMAVSPASQGRGLGRRVMAELERILRARGFEKLVLSSRTSAAGFYERVGYTIVGDEFVDVTIPHVRMTKRL